jgi:hypothetical protein
MKFIKHGYVWDTNKSKILGKTGLVEAWYTDSKGLKENRTFYKTNKGRYFSVATEQSYAACLTEKLFGLEHRANKDPSIRIYEDIAECSDWMESYGLKFPDKLPEA